MTGQHLVLLLWTVWLVVALVSIGGRPGVALLLVVGGLGLGLVLTGLVSWRAYLIAALAVHVLAAAFRAFAQLAAVQPSAPLRDRPPLVITAAVQPGPHAPAASARHRSLGALPASVQRWPLQVLVGSVSLAGVIWLLILRPTVHWLYRADIPIMIGTVALLVRRNTGCWRFYKHLDRRLAETVRQLQEERQQRQDNDKRSHERSEWLEKRLELAESGIVAAAGRAGAWRRLKLRRAQDVLRQAQDRAAARRTASSGRCRPCSARPRANSARCRAVSVQAKRQLPPAPGEQPAASDEQSSPGEQPPAPGEPPPAPGDRAETEDASSPPERGEGDAQAWYRAPGDVQAWAESARVRRVRRRSVSS